MGLLKDIANALSILATGMASKPLVKFEKGGEPNGTETQLYKIREDIINEEEAIHIDGQWYGSPEDRFKGRWNGDRFEIWHLGQWVDGEDVHVELEEVLAKGGKVKKAKKKKKDPKVVRQYFEGEEYEYEKGGKIKGEKQYILNGYSVYIHEDDYEEGEGEEVHSYFVSDEEVFASKKELLDWLNDLLGEDYGEEDYDFDNEQGLISAAQIVVEMSNGDYVGANDAEIDQWKKGEMQLFSMMYSFSVTPMYRALDYAKGGDLNSGKPKVLSIEKYVMNSAIGESMDYDKFETLDNSYDLVGETELTKKEFIKKLVELDDGHTMFDYIPEMEEMEDVDAIVEWLREEQPIEMEFGNTYNDGWFGNAIIVGYIGDRESEHIAIYAMHLGGDVRGNYTPYKAYVLDHMEDDPLHAWNLYVTIQTDKGTISLDADDSEAFYYIVNEDETGLYGDNNNISYDDLEKDLDWGEISFW